MTSQAADPAGTSTWHHILAWAERVRLGKKVAAVLTVAAVLSGLATYAALTESPPLGQDPRTVSLLLNLNLIILLLLGTVIVRRIAGLWIHRKRGLAGARLHVRLVGLFSVVAVAPAILVAAFSAMFLQLGVQSWFSDRVSTAVNESLSVAQAYLAEHQQTLRGDVLSMANDLNREAPHLLTDAEFFNQFVSSQAIFRGLTEAMVFDGDGTILARSGLTFVMQFEPVPDAAVERARRGELVLLTTERDDRVRALIRLDNFFDTYLLVGRLVEAQVIAHMQRAEGAVSEYQELEGRRSALQITFTLIYVVVALLLLLVAVWVGLVFADTVVTPVSALIAAAERVRGGDLTVRVPDSRDEDDELSTLSRAFNRMTEQLDSQRRDLIEANRQLDIRRRFTETVLSGVSAGVLGLDEQGRINLPNTSATELLGLGFDDLIGRPLVEAVPEMAPLMAQIRPRGGRLVEGQVRLSQGSDSRTLLVRIAVDYLDGRVRGYVVTFDDVSELLSAQRKAAWADVARRIAHEIKNPLTPIQLAAERLKRKYRKQITEDPETFETCTDTIVRQVGDIGRMVDEFSAFARMPQPVMARANLSELCQQAAFLRRSAQPEMEIRALLPDQPVRLVCDERLLSQALNNLLKNAVEAIEARQQADGEAGEPGRVLVILEQDGEATSITVEDNGKGLPELDRDRLTEPYVTSRAKGTGLGLAIVKKIMEDHDGRMVLEDRPGGGARVHLIFPHPDPAPTHGPEGPSLPDTTESDDPHGA